MINQLVETQNGEVTTTSLQVAEVFGKQHKNVMRDIQTQLEKIGSSDLSSEMFREDSFENRGKNYPMYRMNKDGFTLLAMSYTTDEAMQFKLRYIKAFNEMEFQLQNQAALDGLFLIEDEQANQREQEARNARNLAMKVNADTRNAKLSFDVARQVSDPVLRQKLINQAGYKLLEN